MTIGTVSIGPIAWKSKVQSLGHHGWKKRSLKTTHSNTMCSLQTLGVSQHQKCKDGTFSLGKTGLANVPPENINLGAQTIMGLILLQPMCPLIFGAEQQ